MSAHTLGRVGLVLVAAAVYLAAWFGWAADWRWLQVVDDRLLVLGPTVAAGHPGWTSFWNVYCDVLSPVTVRIATAVLAVALMVRRQLRLGIYLIVAVGLSGVVTELAKALADRPRPATALTAAHGSSFPSGHALGWMAAVLALYAAFGPALAPARRRAAGLIGTLLVVSVGLGRIALDVHHPSDVVAGWALGYLYFVVCLPLRPVSAAAGTPSMPDSPR